MGAPSEIAAAHRRRSAFDGDNTGRDHKAAQIFDSQDSGKASIAAQEGRRQCDHAFKCSDVEAHRLHLSFSGTLSNCSETCRADSISAMELQSSYDFSEEDIKAGNTLIEDRRYVDTPNTLAATDEFSSFHHEQVCSC